ncbi:hypothetical protein XELAEV_18007768mg [Xenopus laevis]|uniref:Uncharacterized protein n=1 Tax=Xenopus laevis TaxID=8355 RepID=A0A974E2I7_XENLA|nr:hypothetical protein XELAEV_18007768mg [Xenopus laevis]
MLKPCWIHELITEKIRSHYAHWLLSHSIICCKVCLAWVAIKCVLGWINATFCFLYAGKCVKPWNAIGMLE